MTEAEERPFLPAKDSRGCGCGTNNLVVVSTKSRECND